MRYEVKGTIMPIVEVHLTRGETIYSQTGGMCWMTDGISMKTSGRGGLGKMLGRAFSGESMFQTTFTCENENAMVAFAVENPGHIIPQELAAGQSLIAQKGAFLCAQESVTIETHFRKQLGTGLFGGEGFILQKITGPGVAFMTIDGEVQGYNLVAGQMIKVDPGYLAMYEPSVGYDIESIKGVSNMIFGGEGLFLATLRGPGRVWLQTMPISGLAGAIIPFIPTKSS